MTTGQNSPLDKQLPDDLRQTHDQTDQKENFLETNMRVLGASVPAMCHRARRLKENGG